MNFKYLPVNQGNIKIMVYNLQPENKEKSQKTFRFNR